MKHIKMANAKTQVKKRWLVGTQSKQTSKKLNENHNIDNKNEGEIINIMMQMIMMKKIPQIL